VKFGISTSELIVDPSAVPGVDTAAGFGALAGISAAAAAAWNDAGAAQAGLPVVMEQERTLSPAALPDSGAPA
jgi:hypothetical protein